MIRKNCVLHPSTTGCKPTPAGTSADAPGPDTAPSPPLLPVPPPPQRNGVGQRNHQTRLKLPDPKATRQPVVPKQHPNGRTSPAQPRRRRQKARRKARTKSLKERAKARARMKSLKRTTPAATKKAWTMMKTTSIWMRTVSPATTMRIPAGLISVCSFCLILSQRGR